MDERERLREVRRLNDRTAALNVQLDHLEHFIGYAHDSEELQDDLRKLLDSKEQERLNTHKALVKLATKPKGYKSADMFYKEREGDEKHTRAKRKR